MATPTLITSNHLYVLRKQGYERILAPGVAGTPSPIASDGIVVRAQYIKAGSNLDEEILLAKQQLDKGHCPLLFLFASADGVPFRSARIFVDAGRQTISWQENSYIHTNAEAHHFRAPDLNEGYVWESDFQFSRQGWFLTGHSSGPNLQRVARCEVDAFGHRLFTLAPVRLAAGLPTLDLSRIGDALLQGEVLAQYYELQGSVARHAYRDIVTKARNIAEGVLRWALMEAGENPGRDLFEHLQKSRERIEQRSAPFSDLSYHLAHKIRLLHARTHPQQVSIQGRPISPELALTVLEDLKEILTDLGMIQLGTS